jgi:hypothetical protein
MAASIRERDRLPVQVATAHAEVPFGTRRRAERFGVPCARYGAPLIGTSERPSNSRGGTPPCELAL